MLGQVITKDDVTSDGGGVPGVAKAKWGGIFSCWNSCLMEWNLCETMKWMGLFCWWVFSIFALKEWN